MNAHLHVDLLDDPVEDLSDDEKEDYLIKLDDILIVAGKIVVSS